MENGYGSMGQQQYVDEQSYMDQEEEWEREGLLDPAWEKQQKKVSFFLLLISFINNFMTDIQRIFFKIFFLNDFKSRNQNGSFFFFIDEMKIKKFIFLDEDKIIFWDFKNKTKKNIFR